MRSRHKHHLGLLFCCRRLCRQVYADGEGAVELWQDAFGEPADVVLQSPLVYGADLLCKDEGVLVKPLEAAYLGMCGQLCLCMHSARDWHNDDGGAVGVPYIVGNDEYGSSAALLRADNGI